jgi:hypothetical protein
MASTPPTPNSSENKAASASEVALLNEKHALSPSASEPTPKECKCHNTSAAEPPWHYSTCEQRCPSVYDGRTYYPGPQRGFHCILNRGHKGLHQHTGDEWK